VNPPPLPTRKRFPWIIYSVFLVLIILFTVAPIGSVVACSVIANRYGCHVDEGSIHPCVVGGKDYGPLLYQLGVLGWLMLVTLPVGAIAFAAWLIILLLHRSAWRKRTSTNLSPA
jgi:ABC-type sugar transport system permease subunit